MTAAWIARLVVAASLIAWSGSARAQRPALAGEASFGVANGNVLVHYATTGTDAVPMTDANVDGVPDFVAEVAAEAELAYDHFVSLGFRRPLGDGTLGGDGRVDIYLRNLQSADGNAGTDSCVAGMCVGYAVAENDYAGYGYPSRTEAIRSVVPHELFHLVQYAYAMDQPATWTEGTAVWAVEQLYGAGNSDFERFLPAFLGRTYRPFERSVGGFGDAYPYGAALWPYFLEHRFGAGAIVAAWTASERAGFLDAIDSVLVTHDSSVDAAWLEFTRWNALTGPRATLGGAYPDARSWSEAPREPVIDAGGTIYIEGLSARYVPLTVAERSRIEVAPTGGIEIGGWLVADGQQLDDGVELAAEGAAHATTIDAGSYTLVVTGLSRGKITTAVDISLAPPEEDDGDDGGCSSTRHRSWPGVVLVAALALRRRKRR